MSSRIWPNGGRPSSGRRAAASSRTKRVDRRFGRGRRGCADRRPRASTSRDAPRARPNCRSRARRSRCASRSRRRARPCPWSAPGTARRPAAGTPSSGRRRCSRSLKRHLARHRVMALDQRAGIVEKHLLRKLRRSGRTPPPCRPAKPTAARAGRRARRSAANSQASPRTDTAAPSRRRSRPASRRSRSAADAPAASRSAASPAPPPERPGADPSPPARRAITGYVVERIGPGASKKGPVVS